MEYTNTFKGFNIIIIKWVPKNVYLHACGSHINNIFESFDLEKILYQYSYVTNK
jgi:hypothetical protein